MLYIWRYTVSIGVFSETEQYQCKNILQRSRMAAILIIHVASGALIILLLLFINHQWYTTCNYWTTSNEVVLPRLLALVVIFHLHGMF